MSRVAVVTGALGGVGRACVAAFGAAGWTVAATDRNPRPDDLACDDYAQIDLTGADAAVAFAAFLARVGRVDGLVNNAGLLVPKALVDTTDAEWARVMSTNVTAAFVAIRAAHPYLRESHGAIVNVSSVHAIATSPGVAAYATSKGALLALTRAAALELAGDGIRVNAVLPGAVDTPMLRTGLTRQEGGAEAALAELASRIPIGRVAQPDEIASLIVFLSDASQASFLTGQAWIADGGVTARLSSE